MLHEIAITPSVFYRETYAHPDVCDAHMQGIRDALLEYLLIRDLRVGGWSMELRDKFEAMSTPAKELIKKCIKRGRLTTAPSAGPDTPVDSTGWCKEALASHHQFALAGILACPAAKEVYRDEPLVASVAQRSASPWWQQCVTSAHPEGPRVQRTTAEFLTRLGVILRHANHIIFADPHLDPSKSRYGEFVELLKATSRTSGPHPTLEIHRVRYEGSGESRKFPDRSEWEKRFRQPLDATLIAGGISIEVFVWDREHDRHLISNLLGLHVGNGFDTTTDPTAVSTWTRLTSRERDLIQRDYDPKVRPELVYHRFRIGARGA